MLKASILMKPSQGFALDIDIREHNKNEILKNPLVDISKIEGSSVDEEIIEKVHNVASNYKLYFLIAIILSTCFS